MFTEFSHNTLISKGLHCFYINNEEDKRRRRVSRFLDLSPVECPMNFNDISPRFRKLTGNAQSILVN